jgi:hypothetical protein
LRRVLSVSMLLSGLLVLGATLHAQAAAVALEDLGRDVARLEEEIDALEPGDPSTARFRERTGELREELIYLKVKARHHREGGGLGDGLAESELLGVRRRLDDVRADLDRAFGRRAELAVPAGTAIQVSLDDPVSSRTARIEDRVSSRVVQDVRVEGRVAIPAGTQVRGIVRAVEAAKRPSRSGRLELSFDALYVDGERYDVAARVSEIREGSGAAKKAGIGAVVGAVVGGLLGGKDGAIAGVLIGGGGAVAGTKGEDVDLPAGSVVTLRLERAVVFPER